MSGHVYIIIVIKILCRFINFITKFFGLKSILSNSFTLFNILFNIIDLIHILMLKKVILLIFIGGYVTVYKF